MIANYQDLTLGAFLRLYAIPDDMEPLDRQVAILAVLSDCPVYNAPAFGVKRRGLYPLNNSIVFKSQFHFVLL